MVDSFSVQPRSRVFPKSPATISTQLDGAVMSTISEDEYQSNRRNFLKTASACLILTLTRPKEVMAFDADTNVSNNNNSINDDFRFEIKTSFPNGFTPDKLAPGSRLMISVKPAVTYTDQVPKEIADASLSATGHWVPIVLKYNQPCSKVACVVDKNINNNPSNNHRQQFTLTLTNQHVTPEGADMSWWKTLPLIVTAKLDADGLDNTVAPTDLVGCRIIPNNGGIAKQRAITLPLQKRGICSDLLPSSA